MAEQAPSVESATAIRRQLFDAGFRPVPIYNADAAGSSPGKRPYGRKWQEEARKPLPICVEAPAVAWALNTGVLCDGLRAIDLDIEDRSLVVRIRAMASHRFGETAVRTRANSARCLMLYRAAEGEPPKITVAGPAGKVEVLGRGQQFVAFGLHPSGATLEWFPDAPGAELLASVPAVAEEGLFEFLTDVAPLIGADPPRRTNGHDHTTGDPQADPLRVAAAVHAIPNSGPADWEAWNRIGMAIWRTTGASAIGWEAWSAWSARHPEYDPEETRERWDHYSVSPPDQIGAGTLFHMARQATLDLLAENYPSSPETPETSDPGYYASLDTEAAWAADPREAPSADDLNNPDFVATSVTPTELEHVAPREWVYGHFLIRRFISVLGAPGGVGKTAYAYAIALSIISNAELTREKVHEPGNVWIYNLEDPRDELIRRLKAAMLHHGIGFDEIQDRLFLDSGRDRPLVIAKATRDGGMVASPIIPAIIAEIKRRDVRVLIVDPFVRSHRLEENVNEQIDFAAALWGQVAELGNCAVLLLHHFRKGASSGDAASFRGASALIDAARAAISLAPMSEDEASQLGVKKEDRWRFVRADNAKLNLAPPPEHTTWLRLVGVDLQNATRERPADQVQTVERWDPPSPWVGMGMSVVVKILDQIQHGPGDGEQYTVTRGGRSERWAGSVIVQNTDKTDKQAASIIRAWVANGVLMTGRYHSTSQRKERDGLQVDPAKLAEIRASGDGFPRTKDD